MRATHLVLMSIFLTLATISAAAQKEIYATDRPYHYFRDKKYELVIAEVNKLLPLSYENRLQDESYFRKLRAESYVNLGRDAEAIPDYTALIAKQPNATLWLTFRSKIYLKIGKYDLALADTNKAMGMVKDKGLLAAYYVARARIHYAQKNTPLALADIDAALKLDPKHASAFNLRGHMREDAGQNEAAILDYTEAIGNYPYGWEYIRDRALLYAKLDQWQNAVLDMNNVINSVPPNIIDLYIERSGIYLKWGKFSEAIADADSALKFQPEYAADSKTARPAALIARGAAKCSLGKKAEAAADEKDAIKLGGKVLNPCR